MSHEAPRKDFLDTLAEYLDELDPALAGVGVPLHDRALKAALLFAEERIIEVHDGTRENPVGQAWFDALHYHTLRWYERRYGEAMATNDEGEARSIVSLGGVPLSITFPLTVSRPGSKPGTRRLYFPDALREDEQALDFLDAKSGVASLPSAECIQLASEIRRVVGETRRLNRALMFSSLTSSGQRLASRVMWTLKQAVESLSVHSLERLSLAVWELNLVSELALKVYLSQHGPVPKTHGVRSLHRDAVAVGLSPFDSVRLALFPSQGEATRHRYGETQPPDVPKAVGLFNASLSLAVHAAEQCSRTLWVAGDGWIEVRTVGALGRLGSE